MKKLHTVTAALIFGFSTQCWASLIDFESVALETVNPTVTVDGVTASFDNLITLTTGQISYGSGNLGFAPSNSVTNTTNFSGHFLSASCCGYGAYRPWNYTRTITFDNPVNDISMFVADLDAGQRAIISIFDSANTLLHSIDYAGVIADKFATLVDFTGYSSVSKITVVGDDPIGIDNISFTGGASVPAPGTLLLLGLGLFGVCATKQVKTTRL